MFSNTCAMTLAQKSDRILAQTRGLSGATPNATQLIEELRWALEENRREVERLTTIENLSSLANKYRFERDCVRRMYCQEMSAILKPYRAPESIAEDRGWDCYARVSP